MRKLCLNNVSGTKQTSHCKDMAAMGGEHSLHLVLIPKQLSQFNGLCVAFLLYLSTQSTCEPILGFIYTYAN